MDEARDLRQKMYRLHPINMEKKTVQRHLTKRAVFDVGLTEDWYIIRSDSNAGTKLKGEIPDRAACKLTESALFELDRRRSLSWRFPAMDIKVELCT